MHPSALVPALLALAACGGSKTDTTLPGTTASTTSTTTGTAATTGTTPPTGTTGTTPGGLDVCADGTGSFTRIQDALAVAASGDTIEVCAGEYVENLDFGGVSARVVATDGPEVTTLRGDGSGPVVTFASGETAPGGIEGFTITGGNAGGGQGGGILIQGASPEVRNVVITGNTAATGGGLACQGPGANPVMINLHVEGNTATADGGGVYVDGCDAAMLASIVRANEASSGTGGMVLRNVPAGFVLVNTTIVDNADLSGAGAGNLRVEGVETVELYNNIVSHASGGGEVDISGTGGVCAYNDFYLSGNPGPSRLEGDCSTARRPDGLPPAPGAACAPASEMERGRPRR